MSTLSLLPFIMSLPKSFSIETGYYFAGRNQPKSFLKVSLSNLAEFWFCIERFGLGATSEDIFVCSCPLWNVQELVLRGWQPELLPLSCASGTGALSSHDHSCSSQVCGSGTKCSHIMKCIIEFQLWAWCWCCCPKHTPSSSLCFNCCTASWSGACSLDHQGPQSLLLPQNQLNLAGLPHWRLRLPLPFVPNQAGLWVPVPIPNQHLLSEVHSVPANQAPEEVHVADKHNI